MHTRCVTAAAASPGIFSHTRAHICALAAASSMARTSSGVQPPSAASPAGGRKERHSLSRTDSGNARQRQCLTTVQLSVAEPKVELLQHHLQHLHKTEQPDVSALKRFSANSALVLTRPHAHSSPFRRPPPARRHPTVPPPGPPTSPPPPHPQQSAADPPPALPPPAPVSL